MLIKISIPFVLAATILGASVPHRRDDANFHVACPSQGAPGNDNHFPSTGLVGVRDITHDLVGYLAPPSGDNQLFSFTNDKTKALTAAITPLTSQDGGSDDGRYWKIRIGLPGTDNFLGATTITIGNKDGNDKGGASNSPISSVPGVPSTGSPSLPDVDSDGLSLEALAALGVKATLGPLRGSDPSTGSASHSGPSVGGLPNTPAAGGAGPHNPGGPNASAGADASAAGNVSGGGASPPVVPNPPAVGGQSPPSTGVNPPNPPAVGGTPSPASGSPSISSLGKILSRITLGTVNTKDIVAEESNKVLSNADGQTMNLQFVLDKESNQILTRTQLGDDPSSHVQNWQFKDGQFCLCDDIKEAGNQAQEIGSGKYINFFLISSLEGRY